MGQPTNADTGRNATISMDDYGSYIDSVSNTDIYTLKVANSDYQTTYLESYQGRTSNVLNDGGP
jgi:hypothetical protein